MSLLVVQAVDPAAGTSSRANLFAIATVGLDMSTRRFHVLDVFSGRIETTRQPKVVKDQYAVWKPYAVGLESIFYQSDLFRHLEQDGLLPLREIPRRKGAGTLTKYIRFLDLAARYQNGHIIHPDNNPPWLSDFEDELCAINFVDGKERHELDDRVDAVAMAVEMLTPNLVADAFEEPIYHGVEMEE